jgi:peptidoglycan hydrolase-like protein with peptidoglycan-binding domain
VAGAVGDRGAGRRPGIGFLSVIAALLIAIVGLVACSAGLPGSPPPEARPAAEAPEAAAPEPAPEPEPPPAEPPAPDPLEPEIGAVPAQGLGPGDRGPQVHAIEQRLTALHYDVNVLDDSYDQATEHAVVAFQKVMGMERTGRVTQDVADALATAPPPDPLVPDGEPNRVEIDLPRQVLFLYKDGKLFRTLPVSTASGKRFCSEGRCRTSVTPAGSYRVGYRINGWRKSPLGRLYNPVYYMVGAGIAIHGYQNVPREPASHGCVRIPMFAAEWFPKEVPDDTAVYVLDGKAPPAPAPPPGTET